MASRCFNNAHLALDRDVVHLYLIGTVQNPETGGVTINWGKGITSIARDGAGEYTLTLDDTYMRLLDFDGSIERATAVGIDLQLKSETVATTKTVLFGTVDYETPAFTALTAGDKLRVHLTLGNTTD